MKLKSTINNVHPSGRSPKSDSIDLPVSQACHRSGFWTVAGPCYFIITLLFFWTCKEPSGVPESFEIAEGFILQKIAQEPLIFDPVDLEFDAQGRMLVLEMPGYPHEEEQSRIILLEDRDADGEYDQRMIFADSMRLASSILPYREGLLVAAPPYLLYVVDTDGDERADLVDTLMGGFSEGNLQHNFNGLTYGLDNWIYVANGGNNGQPYWWNDTTTAIDLRGQDLRLHLDDKIMQRIGHSSGGFELAVDEWGRIFETHNLEHVSHLVFPSRYQDDLPQLHANTLSNVSDHEENGLARIYPIGEQESRVNHPEQSGYFSGACGITYYGGGAFGSDYDHTVWVNDVVLNLVHVDRLIQAGSAFTAQRTVRNRDVLASTDRSFRPVNLTVGPDGALYLVDMYRQVIEHPEWIPDDIEAGLDLNAGKEKGRIYRIYRQGQDRQFSVIGENCRQLLANLEDANQWVRKTAHHQLVEGKWNAEELQDIREATRSANVWARLQSRWILQARGQLTSDEIQAALADTVAGNRENALVIAEHYLNASDAIKNWCIVLLTDRDQRVRMQAALTLSRLSAGEFKQLQEKLLAAVQQSLDLPADQWNMAALALLFKHDPPLLFNVLKGRVDAKVQTELLPALAFGSGQHPGRLKTILGALADPQFQSPAKLAILQALNKGLQLKNNPADIGQVVSRLEQNADARVLAELSVLRSKLGLRPSARVMAASREALRKVGDDSIADSVRLQQFPLLAFLPYQDKADILFDCLEHTQPVSVQQAALEQLHATRHPDIGKRLVEIWPRLGPQVRKQAGDMLLYTKDYHDALLTGLEEKTINIGEMNFDLERRRTLLWWTDNEDTKRRARALFSDAGVVTRKEVIDKMKPALTMQGTPEKGAGVFKNNCSTCHVYQDLGQPVGPVLTEIRRKSKETLLHDILDPNAAVDTKYINHKIETKDGQVHLGIIREETDTQISLIKMGGSTVTLYKSDIKDFQSLGSSMMMEGLEAQMTHQDMADLLAFLQGR